MHQYSEVNIYSVDGEVVNILVLPEEVNYISGRTSRGNSGLYYKGAGAFYKGHNASSAEGLEDRGPAPVFYYGRNVINKKWGHNFGIFQTKMQPFFSDFIGSCGPKELKLIDNLEHFEQSAVEVVDCVEWDKINNQRYFILRYEQEGRTDWVKDNGNSKDLFLLIGYMLKEDWNFPWDKGSISDVAVTGKVHDVADMFRSKEFIHKFGTVYSLLYSMSNKSKQTYLGFIKDIGFTHKDDKDFVFIALAILDKFGVNISRGFPKQVKDDWDIYYHLVGNCLLAGKNCGYVENVEDGDKIRQQYQERFFKGLRHKDSQRIKNFACPKAA